MRLGLSHRDEPRVSTARGRGSRRVVGIAVMTVILVAALVIGVVVGAADISASGLLREVWAQLVGGHSPLSSRQADIVWQIRVPRVVLAAIVGAALAVAGAGFQGVFRNPLADPYLLGAAAGAGLGATIVIVNGWQGGGWRDPVAPAAFAGALLGVGLAGALGRVAGRGSAGLLLAGVAVASFLSAVQTFLQQQNSDDVWRVYTWMLGGLATEGWGDVALAAPYVALAGVVLIACSRMLDVLAVGDEETRALGINPTAVRITVLLAASLATAAAVSVAGLISFVGLVVPHIVRLLVGGSYRLVVPYSLAGGAAFLVLADVVARTIMSPAELPIGVVTAFAGAPFFAVVLRATRRSAP